MSEPTTEAGRHTHASVRSSHSHLGYPPHAHSWRTIEDAAVSGYGQAEARASQPLTLDVALLAEALFEARIGVPKDTPYLAGLLLPVIQRLQAEEALERESAT